MCYLFQFLFVEKQIQHNISTADYGKKFLHSNWRHLGTGDKASNFSVYVERDGEPFFNLFIQQRPMEPYL